MVADRCKLRSLSDPAHSDFQKLCDHMHSCSTTSCDNLSAALQEREKFLQATGIPLSKEQRGDLLHDFVQAKTHIFN